MPDSRLAEWVEFGVARINLQVALTYEWQAAGEVDGGWGARWENSRAEGYHVTSLRVQQCLPQSARATVGRPF